MNRAIFVALALLLAQPAWAESHELLADDPVKDDASTLMEESAEMDSTPMGSVSRASFTTGISEHEPMDSVTQLTNEHVIVYFFSELHDLAGKTVAHRWEYNGEVMAEVPLAVGGPRWRTYSTKTLEPSWVGEWTVSVVDEHGNVLAARSLSFNESMEKAVPASPME